MDVFDEFEMKPLTEGLGFHRKSNELKDSMKKSNVLSNKINADKIPVDNPPNQENSSHSNIDKATEALDKLMNSLNTLDKKGITFTETLPRDNSDSQVQTLQQPSIHPVVPDSPPLQPVKIETPVSKESILKENKTVDLTNLGAGTRRGASDSFVGNLKAAPVSIPAAILDSIVIFAISILFLMGMLVATGVQISALVESISADAMTKISAFMLYIAVLQMYVVVARSFFGSTLGEWTFDCQMGTDSQAQAPYYPFQIVWRSLIMIGTGLVIIPFLSLISRRDLGAYMTGLQLYKRM